MLRTLLSQFWLQKLGWTLLHFLWQGTVILIIYVVLRALLGRALSAPGRYLLACLALAAMTLAPLLTFLLLPGRDHTDSLPVLPWNISVAAWQQFSPWFVAAWMAGVLAFSFRMLGGWRFTTRLRTKAVAAPPEWQSTLDAIAARIQTSGPVRLLISPGLAVPVVIGWLKPVILLPVSALTGLPVEHIRVLLAHELAHIRRRDYIANILQSVAEAALFYHPAVWWVSSQIRNERELCCDDIAVAHSGDPLVYATALARLESIQPPNVQTVLAASGGSLLNRVRRLIEPTRPVADDLPGAGAAWAMTLLWAAGLGIATVHAAQKPAIVPDVALIDAVAQPGRPSPFADVPGRAVSRARKTLMFDPFLSARMVSPTGEQDRASANAPEFEVADIRATPRVVGHVFGGFYGGNRFDVQSATLMDLITAAYEIDSEKIVGGPSWLQTDRFDVSAIAPANSTPANLHLMLRTLLAKRFNLAVRNDKKVRPTFALTAGSKPQLQQPKASDESGCKLDFQRAPADGAAPTLTYAYTCRNMTMPAFAELLRTLIGRDSDAILDETGIKGTWDFNFKFTFQAVTRVPALFDALEKQLGLKLEPRMAPAPVLAVEAAARPSDNAPGVAEKLVAAYPAQFEVADIRPSDPNSNLRNGFQPGGRLTMRGVTLRYLILTAWNLTTAELADGPPFLDTDRFDLIAKAPASAVSGTITGLYSVDPNALRLMLRSLLTERFGLIVHTEDRPIPGFTLAAGKPKLTPATPGNRSGCFDRPAASAVVNRVVACQNMTMAQFARDLPVFAGGYFGGISRNVLDNTDLDGAWDFTLSFSGASTIQPATPMTPGQVPDPTGQVTLFDAIAKLGLKLETQRRPSPVLVIDHIEQKPTDN